MKVAKIVSLWRYINSREFEEAIIDAIVKLFALYCVTHIFYAAIAEYLIP